MKRLAAAASLVVLLGLGAAAFVWSGLYDISATDNHLAPTFHAIKKTMERSVERRSKDIAVPPLGAPGQLARGHALFRRHCVQCHGAPGVAPEPFALGLTPLPTPLARSGRERPPAYLYWIVREGIKMTAMPAWKFRLGEDDSWALVAFVKRLPLLSPAEYRALPLLALSFEEPPLEGAPDPARGRKALEQYACVACHEIPGMVGPQARLGPTLHGVGARGTLGGVLPNSPENMVRWIIAPQEAAPLTAMPALGVTQRDARDMAAYLSTLR